jgi:hypothetical protein
MHKQKSESENSIATLTHDFSRQRRRQKIAPPPSNELDPVEVSFEK